MDNSTPGGLDWTSYAGGDTTTVGTGSSGGGTDWLTGLANVANAGANAYRTANGQKPKTTTTNVLPYIILGAVGLVLVLVLALKK